MGSILLGFLDALLDCAIVVFIAFALRWVIVYFAGGIDGNVDKWGRIVVALLCIIILAGWLIGTVLGFGGGSSPNFFPRRFFSSTPGVTHSASDIYNSRTAASVQGLLT